MLPPGVTLKKENPTLKPPTLPSAPRLVLSKPSREPPGLERAGQRQKVSPHHPQGQGEQRGHRPLGITVHQQHLVL